MSTAGGCGIALHPNGYLYSNMRDSNGVGVAQIDLATGDSVRMGPAGNALGIAVDPVSNHLVYAGAGFLIFAWLTPHGRQGRPDRPSAPTAAEEGGGVGEITTASPRAQV